MTQVEVSATSQESTLAQYLISTRHRGFVRFKPQILYILSYLFLLSILSIFNKKSVFVFSLNALLFLVFLIIASFIVAHFLKSKDYSAFTLAIEWSPIFLITYIYRTLATLNENIIYPRVHVKELYILEEKIFSKIFGGQMPNYWLYNHFHCPVVDFIVGVIYITDLFIPVCILLYFYLKQDRSSFYYGTLILAGIGFFSVIIFAVFPAAAPWYVEHFGFQQPQLIYAENYSWYLAAKLKNFDQLVNYPFFNNFYRGQSRDFFAAFPSVHVAYGFATILITHKHWKRKSLLVSAPYALLVFFSAVYSYHHYIIDGLAGIVCCIISALVAEILQKHM